MRKNVATTPPPKPRWGNRDRFIIFLPKELGAAVRAQAAEGRRPINTQFEILIEQALRKDAVAA